MRFGLIRNHYVGRTFIEPAQSIRHFGVKVKLNPVRSLLKGQRVVLIDDSIVRGTTSRKIVKMVRAAGAAEVHVRISCPPTISPCFYGVDTPQRSELIAATHSLEEIRKYLDADSVAYLSLEGLLSAVTPDSGRYCTSCYTGQVSGGVPPRPGGLSAALPEARQQGRRDGTCGAAGGAGSMSGTSYKAAGVDIDAGNETVRRIKSIARGTFTAGVLSEIGSFGGLFSLASGGWADPVLVASADGVGTKLKVAFLAGVHDTIGRDLVNHCVNDILVQGATPLFFLDYLATGRLSPDVAEQIVKGLAAACRENGCALLGGETAEMPGFYADGEYDVAGFIVGAVERARLVDGKSLVPGDVLLALPSVGLHTNGYSLARQIVFERLGLGVDSHVAALGETVGAALLRPHKSYLRPVQPLLAAGIVKGLAHITGGGLTDNLPRILPEGTAAEVRRGSWPVLPLFAWLAEAGQVALDDQDPGVQHGRRPGGGGGGVRGRPRRGAAGRGGGDAASHRPGCCRQSGRHLCLSSRCPGDASVSSCRVAGRTSRPSSRRSDGASSRPRSPSSSRMFQALLLSTTPLPPASRRSCSRIPAGPAARPTTKRWRRPCMRATWRSSVWPASCDASRPGSSRCSRGPS